MQRHVLIPLAVLLLALALVPLASARPDWNSNYFSSPSGNIRCREFVNKDVMACLTLNDHFLVAVGLTGRAVKRTNIADFYFPHGPVLQYGDHWADSGRFRCLSTFNGMRCTSLQSGHGFFVNRDQYGLF